MFLLKNILAALVLPPASLFLLAAGGLWLSRRRPRLGHSLLAVALGALLLLSMSGVANELLRSLEVGDPPTPEQLAESQAIIVLGGGSYRAAPEYGGDTVNDVGLERLRYGARLARQTGLPVGIAGGAPLGGTPEAESMREVLESDFRVVARWVETASQDTNENAAHMAPLLKQAGITHIALVTHAWHMRRAQAAFESHGLTVLAAPTRFAPAFQGGILRWMPNGGALRSSQVALHEWLGILAARAGGLAAR